MITLFAHAGEEHTDLVMQTVHWFEEWYIALPASIVLVALIGYLVWLVSNRNRHMTLGVVTFTLLILGFTTFSVSPLVSILSIFVGLLLSAFAAVTSIIS